MSQMRHRVYLLRGTVGGKFEAALGVTERKPDYEIRKNGIEYQPQKLAEPGPLNIRLAAWKLAGIDNHRVWVGCFHVDELN